jgi:hypothetical protein
MVSITSRFFSLWSNKSRRLITKVLSGAQLPSNIRWRREPARNILASLETVEVGWSALSVNDVRAAV